MVCRPLQVDRGRLVAAGVERDLCAVGQRPGVAGGGLGERREIAGGRRVRAADAAEAAGEPEARAAAAQAEDHAARRRGDLLQAFERPAVAEGARRLVDHRRRAAVGDRRVGGAVVDDLHRVRVPAGATGWSLVAWSAICSTSPGLNWLVS